MIRKGGTLIVPGFGLMEGDFTFYVARTSLLRVHVDAGLMSGSFPRRDFRKAAERRTWIHKDIA